MLTADLVHVRRRGDQLQVVPLGAAERERARELADAYVGLVRGHVGLSRGALAEACKQVPFAARERRLAHGLLKLVTDRCEFDEGTALDAATLRRDLFQRAAAARRAEGARGHLDRDALVAAVAAELVTTPTEIEAALYADLPEAHRLRTFDAVSPEALVGTYETAQVQATLLRALRVQATVRAAPAATRALFRRLKFLRLLHRIERLPEDAGYRVEIDGPFSLFESVTKYGLQLALAFPAIAACAEWTLEADLRWGREQRPLRLRLRGRGTPEDATDEAALPDDVQALLARLREQESPWRAAVAGAVLDLPGVGVCIPDLEFVHATTGRKVYLEVLGFWSREAVWRRVELVERGLPHPLVFAVSKHLRVSEDALPADAPARLYVYSRTMNARALLEHVEAAGGSDLHRGTETQRSEE